MCNYFNNIFDIYVHLGKSPRLKRNFLEKSTRSNKNHTVIAIPVFEHKTHCNKHGRLGQERLRTLRNVYKDGDSSRSSLRRDLSPKYSHPRKGILPRSSTSRTACQGPVIRTWTACPRSSYTNMDGLPKVQLFKNGRLAQGPVTQGRTSRWKNVYVKGARPQLCPIVSLEAEPNGSRRQSSTSQTQKVCIAKEVKDKGARPQRYPIPNIKVREWSISFRS